MAQPAVRAALVEGQEVWVRAIVRVVDLRADRYGLDVLGHSAERLALYQRVHVPASEIERVVAGGS